MPHYANLIYIEALL